MSLAMLAILRIRIVLMSMFGYATRNAPRRVGALDLPVIYTLAAKLNYKIIILITR